MPAVGIDGRVSCIECNTFRHCLLTRDAFPEAVQFVAFRSAKRRALSLFAPRKDIPFAERKATMGSNCSSTAFPDCRLEYSLETVARRLFLWKTSGFNGIRQSVLLRGPWPRPLHRCRRFGFVCRQYFPHSLAIFRASLFSFIANGCCAICCRSLRRLAGVSWRSDAAHAVRCCRCSSAFGRAQ